MSPNLETSRYLSIFSWLSEGSFRADGRRDNVCLDCPPSSVRTDIPSREGLE
jgi:hypothetical protein